MKLTKHDQAQAERVSLRMQVIAAFGDSGSYSDTPMVENEYVQALRSDTASRHIAKRYSIDETSVRGHRLKMRAAEKRKALEVAV